MHASNYIQKNVKKQICFDLIKQNVSKTYRMHKKNKNVYKNKWNLEKMENMDDRGKESPTCKTKLAVEPVSKIPKIKPEGCKVFIEHLPPRTSPHVSLPIMKRTRTIFLMVNRCQ